VFWIANFSKEGFFVHFYVVNAERDTAAEK